MCHCSVLTVWVVVSGRRSAQDLFSEDEVAWREASGDFTQRFCGHCNTTTDIKEANFFGR